MTTGLFDWETQINCEDWGSWSASGTSRVGSWRKGKRRAPCCSIADVLARSQEESTSVVSREWDLVPWLHRRTVETNDRNTFQKGGGRWCDGAQETEGDQGGV